MERLLVARASLSCTSPQLELFLVFSILPTLVLHFLFFSLNIDIFSLISTLFLACLLVAVTI